MTDHDEDASPVQESSRTQPAEAEAAPPRALRTDPAGPCANRTRVGNTTNLPYTLIGQLIVTFPSTSRFEPVTYCTGLLIDERHVLTAAHNLYHPRLGLWAYSVGFQAARDGSLVHYPSVAGLKEPSRVIPAGVKELVVKFYAGELPDMKAPPYDYCVLELSNVVITNAEWPTVCAPMEAELDVASVAGSRLVNITGYPGEPNPFRSPYPDYAQEDAHTANIPLGTMWGQRGFLSGYSNSLLSYDICATGGQSGAPILMNQSGEPHDWMVVGIHLFSGRPSNVGLRFTDDIVRDIQQQAPKVKIRSAPAAAPSANMKGKETMPTTQNSITWTETGDALETTAAMFGGATFAVEVSGEQANAWSNILTQTGSSSTAPGMAGATDAVETYVTDGTKEITLALIQRALPISAIAAFAGILAYAISRNYTVKANKTGNSWSFEFSPGQ